jgi:hypothetical protein
LSRRSFLYLHYSSRLDVDGKLPKQPYLYNGGLIPLVDLRIHSPLLPAGSRTTNR